MEFEQIIFEMFIIVIFEVILTIKKFGFNLVIIIASNKPYFQNSKFF
jgi:hypothetical protein